jgi:serine/threonine-protein kinase RsbW
VVIRTIGNLPHDAIRRMRDNGHRIHLEFCSAFEMLDLVQIVSDAFGRMSGLDDDALHWIGVAIRESVINAIKHGNRNDAGKLVFVDLATEQAAGAPELVVRVRDQGEGFDSEALRDPLAPENLLRSSGRGIFFMRSFMDDVQIARANGGGMEVRMVKRFPPVPARENTPHGPSA